MTDTEILTKSEMMSRLAVKLGRMTNEEIIHWSRVLMPKSALIGDEYWSSEIDGKCFRLYEYRSIGSRENYGMEVRLELWDTERENCETIFPENRAFGNLLGLVRDQTNGFTESAKQFVNNLVNAAS